MKVFMTSGTMEYLIKIKEKHVDAGILIMITDDKTIAYQETETKTVFEEAREYEAVVSKGEVLPEGFVVMNNIPVTDEGRPIFEDLFKQRAGKIEQTPGFYGLRVLRPSQGNTYVVMVQWKDETSFKNWKNSDSFQKSHQKSTKQKEGPAFAAGPSYVTTYHIADEG